MDTLRFSQASKVGELAVLVNNAGVGTFKAVEKITLKEWQNMMDVNLTGAFLATQEAVKLMKKVKAGHIFFINSLSGKRALSWGSGYSATKYGLRGFADTVRIELRKSNIKKDKRPKLFMVGQRDRVVPSVDLQRELDEVRQPVQFVELPGDNHSLSSSLDTVAERVAEFLLQTLNEG